MHNLVQKYERNYKAEVKLNADFNAYVRGYELAYNGPNTIRHQLGLRGGEFLDDGEFCTALSMCLPTEVIRFPD